MKNLHLFIHRFLGFDETLRLLIRIHFFNLCMRGDNTKGGGETIYWTGVKLNVVLKT